MSKATTAAKKLMRDYPEVAEAYWKLCMLVGEVEARKLLNLDKK